MGLYNGAWLGVGVAFPKWITPIGVCVSGWSLVYGAGIFPWVTSARWAWPLSRGVATYQWVGLSKGWGLARWAELCLALPCPPGVLPDPPGAQARLGLSIAGRVGLWKDIFTVSMNEKFDLVYKQKMGKCDVAFDFCL